jgi:hypothetical protein
MSAVLTMPGDMQFTLTPLSAHSIARLWVSFTTAPEEGEAPATYRQHARMQQQQHLQAPKMSSLERAKGCQEKQRQKTKCNQVCHDANHAAAPLKDQLATETWHRRLLQLVLPHLLL